MEHTEETERNKKSQPTDAPQSRLPGWHVRQAHANLKGEHQLPEYVSLLELSECARILAATEIGLPSLATRYEMCRVGAEEERDFEEVIRTWTVYVLSIVEAG